MPSTRASLLAGFNRQLGLSDELFALADTALLTVLGQVAFMPLLVLAARICPEASRGGRGWGGGGCGGRPSLRGRLAEPPGLAAMLPACMCGCQPIAWNACACTPVCGSLRAGYPALSALIQDVSTRGRCKGLYPCPPSSQRTQGVEATLFATLMSISNSGMFVGNALGSGLTSALGVTADSFDNLAPLVALCTLSTLLPLPLLRLLPEDVDKEKAEGGEIGSGEMRKEH